MIKKGKYSGLEILCEGEGKAHTGYDVKILLDGEPVTHRWSITKVKFDVTPKKSVIKIYYTRDLEKLGELFKNDKGKIIEKVLRITYPIKKIHIDYSCLSFDSNNTPMGTNIHVNGMEYPSIEFHVEIDNSNEINKYTIVGC